MNCDPNRFECGGHGFTDNGGVSTVDHEIPAMAVLSHDLDRHGLIGQFPVQRDCPALIEAAIPGKVADSKPRTANGFILQCLPTTPRILYVSDSIYCRRC